MGTPPIFPCGNTGGEGDALIRSLCCGYSFQPLRLVDTSSIFCVVKHPVRLRDTAERRLIPFCFFNPFVSSWHFILYFICHKTPCNATRHGWEMKENLYWQNRFFAFMLRWRSKKFKRILNILPSIIFNCAVKKLSLCPEEKKGYELTISKPCQRQ